MIKPITIYIKKLFKYNDSMWIIITNLNPTLVCKKEVKLIKESMQIKSKYDTKWSEKFDQNVAIIFLILK